MFSQSIFKNQIFRSNRRLWNTTTRPKNVGNPPPPPRLTFTTLFLRSHLRLPPLSLQIRHRSLLSHPPLPSLFRPRSPPLSPPMSSADSNTTNTKTCLRVSLDATVRLLHCDLEVMGSSCGNSLFAWGARLRALTFPRPRSGGSLVHWVCPRGAHMMHLENHKPHEAFHRSLVLVNSANGPLLFCSYYEDYSIDLTGYG
ncbi:uncharacterized protein LOC130794560 isoform X3 [Actinidia eriantha]|uniref:uncharacterized protein LOC130794560 isoform X3 n=1 Tax=Actinidia eriantha TaxID=165200 RepID=UPI002587860C|nr:uncharacterized protein LOC130794560 isoform X3 [Actinidia eriantha]